nr:MAG TPA: S-Ribosylhomocysteinase (LuxS) [Caudoviricetes sp.]DAZ06292.1 MAG TPA: S-Ribosylhomocysteinase (LuxS) [Caudoviricetes sp.]
MDLWWLMGNRSGFHLIRHGGPTSPTMHIF